MQAPAKLQSAIADWAAQTFKGLEQAATELQSNVHAASTQLLQQLQLHTGLQGTPSTQPGSRQKRQLSGFARAAPFACVTDTSGATTAGSSPAASLLRTKRGRSPGDASAPQSSSDKPSPDEEERILISEVRHCAPNAAGLYPKANNSP